MDLIDRQQEWIVPGRVAYLALVGAVMILAQPAFAGEEFPIEGTYRQDAPCVGDGSDPKPLLVTITPQNIHHGGGDCAIADKRYTEKTLTVRATCKFKSRELLASDISFTLRDDKTIGFEDQDKTFSTVLYRCPR